MPEYHPGTDIEIPNGVPTSGFRNAIPNTKRYMKHNKVQLKDVCEAAYTGDYHLLETMLASGHQKTLFNGDLNSHVNNITALHMAAMSGQTECIELLLSAKADPHVKESMNYGNDPEDGKTALEFAKGGGYDDICEILEQAEKDSPFGWYVPSGLGNNAKVYNCWEWGKKPPKGYFSSRPGAAEANGFDPMKYGTGPVKDDDDEEEIAPQLNLPRAPAAVSAPISKAPSGPPTIPVGLLFPGQGSQCVKMLSQVKDIPAVKEMISKASGILGYDILELCMNGPEEKLEATTYCQPAMFLAGLAAVERLRSEREEAVTQFQVCAGLSLGEYTALCAAGVFTFEDGLKLVQLRGKAMQDAAAIGKQAMLSVAGFEKEKLAGLCKDAAKKEGGKAVCQIANELFPKGFSCAGTEKAIGHLKELAEAGGALQAKVLKTSGGFHTSLMEPAKAQLGKALDEVLPRMQSPKHTIYMNATAAPLQPGTDPKVVVDLLKKQLTSPVLWEPSVQAMIKAGVTEFYECGPNKQIKAMMKRINPKVWDKTTNVLV
eukprot:CAMPEP_0197624252 /NCGR_PEP_ID=MMETSP1338-20131121/3965_1 /TAXON_ID=43686 ORGANISM="Pelagodinium beii, Strain RCC1491" /NCGR_SAMPLE_ID=MMETSP1338 /ASSEMBLY_ACC=CAM_ASM_000754 /LENGTH=543 /DNA_ID=CAMNT_0043194361 /DNA_START=62 /DNA_END=1693 /DNA_ORIENTATION=+